MAHKIYSTGNYFIIELEGSVEPKQDSKALVNVWLEDDGTKLYRIESPKLGDQKILLSDMEDEGGTPYNQTTWEAFYYENSGFNPASGGSGAGINFKYTATNYTDLTTVVAPVAAEGELAVVYNSQGIWPVNRKFKGAYIYQSGVWGYANQEMQDILKAKLDNVIAGSGISINYTNPLAPIISGLKFDVDLDSAESSVTRVFAGGRTTFTVTHGLNTLDIQAQVFRLSDGRTIGWRIERTGINTVGASRAGNVADNLFRILIKG